MSAIGDLLSRVKKSILNLPDRIAKAYKKEVIAAAGVARGQGSSQLPDAVKREYKEVSLPNLAGFELDSPLIFHNYGVYKTNVQRTRTLNGKTVTDRLYTFRLRQRKFIHYKKLRNIAKRLTARALLGRLTE